MSSVFPLGFTASAWWRLAAAVVVVLAALALVLVVERPRGQLAAASAPVARSAESRRLRVESSFPVESWTVTVGGRAGVADFSDSGTWQGTVDLPAGAELLVIARAASSPSGQRCALRLVIDGDPAGERSAWGDGLVVATVRLP